MRDLALTLTLVVLAPLALRFPFVGVYLWAWLSLMNPHRLAYGFTQELPLNMVVAVLTLIGFLFSSDRIKIKASPLVIYIAAFSVWMTITTVFAPVHEVTTPLWSRNIKTMLLLFTVIALITNRVRLNGLIWIMVISLGYFGLKGGVFMILTGGNHIVFGPPQTMITDNNALALALILMLPVMNYLRIHTDHRFLKACLIGVMLMTLAAGIGSYSRGGFIAMAAMLTFLWLKSRTKVTTGILALGAVLAVMMFMPEQYFARINTINEFLEDPSFRGRLDAWEVAWHTATDNLFGAGFDGPRQDVMWSQYLPAAAPRASHSIYFMVLGEHGFVGLFLYLGICIAAWRNYSKVIVAARGRPDLLWTSDLAASLQVAMVGFMVGGAALPMAYYDGFLLILAISGCLRLIAQESTVPAAFEQSLPPAGHRAFHPKPLLQN